jgi:hypothetical protein
MTLATVTSAGAPSARIVLLKGVERGQFLFYTNYLSRKGRELEHRSAACLVFLWSELERQVRIDGLVQKLGDAAAGAESTDDAFESILEVANRFNKGEWNKNREGGGTAKGSSELVVALTEFMQTQNPEGNVTKDTVRELLASLNNQEKASLRKVPEVAAIIERLKAERKPSKGEAERVEAGKALLSALAAGKVPERKTEDAAADQQAA